MPRTAIRKFEERREHTDPRTRWMFIPVTTERAIEVIALMIVFVFVVARVLS